jgi:hypothetical protein
MRLKAACGVGVAVLAMAILVGSSDGQGKTKGQLPQGWKDLGLTAAQKEKVYEINAKFKARLDQLDEQEKAIRAEMKAEQFKVLTDDQKEKLKKLVTGEAVPDKKDDKK